MFNRLKKQAEKDLAKAEGDDKKEVLRRFRGECVACLQDGKKVFGGDRMAGRFLCSPHYKKATNIKSELQSDDV